MNHNHEILQLKKKVKYYRILAITVLILSCVFIFVAYYNISKDYPVYKNLSLIDPDRKFKEKESYVINIQDLRKYLYSLGEKYPDSISIYYEQINSGANISINKDLRLFPASLSKLVQAIIVTKKIEEGSLSWNQKLETLPSDISSDSGDLYKTIGNTQLTVDRLLQELLINSDNTAQNIFRHQLDFPDYVKFQEETGLEDLYNDKGFISAKEYTRISRVLYTSSYLKPENSQKILELMVRSKFRDYLSQGIPSDVKFAHKYGENKQYDIFADSGIVYVPGRPYMITVIIKGKDSSLETRAWAVELMKEISEHVYETSK